MGIRDTFKRAVRSNLNEILDRVNEFERDGGFKTVFDTLDNGFAGLPAPTPGDKTLRDYYANLEVPYGSDLDTVKESYRRLMRKYHPDRHADSPEMEELATELTQEITRAYQAVESYLTTGRY